MKDEDKTKEQCINELEELRKQNAKLKGSETELKQLKETLYESEERYYAFFKQAADSIVLVNGETGELVEFNQRAYENLGYTHEEFVKLRIADFEVIETSEDVKKHIEKIVKDGADTFETKHRTKGGEIRDIQVNSRVIFVHGKKFVQSIWRDITERKKIEEEIKRAKDHLDNIIESSLDPIIITDEIGNITRVNRSFLTLLGYRKEVVVGKHASELGPIREGIHESTTGELIQINRDYFDAKNTAVSSLAEDGKLSNRVSYLLCENNKVVPIEMSIVFLHNKDGERTGAVGMVRDNTERRKAEKEIREQKDFLESVIEGSRDGIAICDEKGYILSVNTAIEKMSTFQKDELVGKHASTLAMEDKDMRKKILEKMEELFEKGFTSYESQHKLSDATLLDVECSSSIIKDDKGNYIAGVSIIRDITERKKAQEKIIEHQNHLKSLASQLTLVEEKERRRFADYLHDQIGQKLFISKLKLEVLKKSLSSTDNVRVLNEIHEFILQLIKDTRSLTFDISPPVLYQLGLEAALEWLTGEMSEKYGIMIAFEDDGQEIALVDDTKILLFQAVRELLYNVAKHAKTHNAKVSIQRDNVYVRICVEDEGVGFAPLDRTSPVNSDGGFGLFSIEERLDHIGGQFKIKSRPGHGTKATLLAPLKGMKESLNGK